MCHWCRANISELLAEVKKLQNPYGFNLMWFWWLLTSDRVEVRYQAIIQCLGFLTFGYSFQCSYFKTPALKEMEPVRTFGGWRFSETRPGDGMCHLTHVVNPYITEEM